MTQNRGKEKRILILFFAAFFLLRMLFWMTFHTVCTYGIRFSDVANSTRRVDDGGTERALTRLDSHRLTDLNFTTRANRSGVDGGGTQELSRRITKAWKRGLERDFATLCDDANADAGGVARAKILHSANQRGEEKASDEPV